MRNAVDYLHINPIPYVPQYSQLAAHYLVGYLQEAGKSWAIISATHQLLENTLKLKAPEIAHRLKQPLSNYVDFLSYLQGKHQLEEIITKSYSNDQEQLRYVHNHLKLSSNRDVETFSGLLSLLQHPEQSVFYDYIEKNLIPDILQYRPKVLGITIGDKRQIPFSFALLWAMKKFVPTSKCWIGGYIPSVCSRDLWLHKDEEEVIELFGYLDFIVHNEWEIPLLKYIDYIDGKEDIHAVPQLIYKENNQIMSNSLDADWWVIEEKMSSMSNSYTPRPYFTSEQLAQQLMPQWWVVSLLTKRWCSYRCSFCAIDKGYNRWAIRISQMATSSSRKQPPLQPATISNTHQIINDIEYYYNQGTRVFSIVDETLSPSTIEQLCHLLDEKQISWCSFEYYTTLHPKFLVKEFCRKIVEHGFIFPQFWLETLSPTALTTSQKNQNLITLSQQDTILQNCREAGIMPHVFLMIGLPNQTSIDLLQSLSFLQQHWKHMLTIKPTTVKIAKYSEDAIRPDQIGVILWEAKPFTANIPFQHNEHSSIKRISKKSASARKIVFETRIALRHTYNIFTKHVPYASRLTVWKETIEDIVDKANRDTTNSLLPRLDGELAEHWKEKISRAFTHIIKELLSEISLEKDTEVMIKLIKGLSLLDEQQAKERLKKKMLWNLKNVEKVLHQCDLFSVSGESIFEQLLEILEDTTILFNQVNIVKNSGEPSL